MGGWDGCSLGVITAGIDVNRWKGLLKIHATISRTKKQAQTSLTLSPFLPASFSISYRWPIIFPLFSSFLPLISSFSLYPLFLSPSPLSLWNRTFVVLSYFPSLSLSTQSPINLLSALLSVLHYYLSLSTLRLSTLSAAHIAFARIHNFGSRSYTPVVIHFMLLLLLPLFCLSTNCSTS